MFKDGSMVIPGNSSITMIQLLFNKIERDHLGVPVSLYVDELKGKDLNRVKATGVSVTQLMIILYPEDNSQD